MPSTKAKPKAKRTRSTTSPSRTTTAQRRADAGFEYVAGWLPAGTAKAVKAQIAASAAKAAKAATTAKAAKAPTKTPAASRRAKATPPGPLAAAALGGRTRAERIALAG